MFIAKGSIVRAATPTSVGGKRRYLVVSVYRHEGETCLELTPVNKSGEVIDADDIEIMTLEDFNGQD
jgi:hypothetical protein